MAVLDLSKVTDAIRRLIAEGVASSAAWSPNPAPDVLPLPPEHITGEALGLHLYALGENGHFKNPVGPVASHPLALDLYYQLTAHGQPATPTLQSVQREHLLLGLAMKVLHDFPTLDSTLTVNGVQIFTAVGLSDDNVLRVELQTVEPEQAVTWWTASSESVRPSAYYQVAVAFLEPEPAPAAAPPVLGRSILGFVGTAPYVEGTEASHLLALPGQAPQTITVSPAQIEPGGSFTITGSGLGGDPTVTLSHEAWAEPAALAGGSYLAAGDREELTVGVDPVVGGNTVLPGLYAVRVIRHDIRRLDDGSERDFPQASNEGVVLVVPAVTSLATPPGPYEVTGGPFEHSGITSVRVLVDGIELTATAAAPVAGEFQVVDAQTIEFRLPTDPPSGASVRLRLIVNGVENLPFWFTAP